MLRDDFVRFFSDFKTCLDTESVLQVANEIEEYLEVEGLQLSCVNELQPYCNYLNCDLMKSLVNVVSVEDDLKTRIKEYSRALTQFQSSSQLQYVAAAMRRPVSKKPSSMSTLTLKLNSKWKEMTLQNLLIAINYCLRLKRLYLSHIYHDKSDNKLLHVKFLISQSQVQSLEALTLSNSERIHELGILEIRVSGKLISACTSKEIIDYESICLKAAERGDFIRLLLLLELGVSLDCTNEEDETPLMVAVRNKQQQTVKTLVAAGADVRKCDIRGYTASMIASELYQSEIIRILHPVEAKVNLKDKHTPAKAIKMKYSVIKKSHSIEHEIDLTKGM